MNNKRNLGAILALSSIFGNCSIYAADQEQKAGFLPQIKQVTPTADQKKLSGSPECVLRIALPGMPSIKQKTSDIQSPSGGFSVERRSPRYDGVLQSPVLSSAGVKLKPLASSASISSARLPGECADSTNK